jgi:hypothetical protein
MNIKIQIVIESENGNPEVVQEVAQLKREALRIEEFGLTLSEAKSVLQGLQQSMVERQSAEIWRSRPAVHSVERNTSTKETTRSCIGRCSANCISRVRGYTVADVSSRGSKRSAHWRNC